MATPEELEKAKQVAKQIEAEFKVKDAENNVRIARGVLMGVGILQILAGIIAALGSASAMGIFYTNLIIGLVFIGLFILSKSQALIAVAIGLGSYVALQILIIATVENGLIRGLVLKIIVIVLLVIGLIAARRVSRSKKDDSILDNFN